MRVLLIGMTNSGKTTLGTELARRWGCAFRDLDRMIEDHHECDTGERLTVREIYARDGAEAFREWEHQAVAELSFALEQADGHLVAAVGGNTATSPLAAKMLGGLAVVVWLEVEAAVLYDRLTDKGTPAFLDGNDPRQAFEALCRRRREDYARLADVAVDVTGLDVAAAADALEAALKEHDHAG